MTQAQVFEAIRTRFRTVFEDAESVPVVYDNAPEPARAQSWCRFSIQVDTHEQVAMGATRYRMTGVATALLFVPNEKGNKTQVDLADAIVAGFRGVRLTSPSVVFTPPPGIVSAGARDEVWHVVTVQIPFRADEVA